jgi:hypothetical protein
MNQNLCPAYGYVRKRGFCILSEMRPLSVGQSCVFASNARRLNHCVTTTFATRFCRYIVNSMRCVNRLAGLFSALSLVASVVVTSGFACEHRDGADTMAGMTMANSADAPTPVAGIESKTGEAPASDPAPCGLPSAPSTCQSMVACAPIAVASQRVGIAAPSRAMVRVASLAMLTPSSETKAPELPPPRA